MRVDKRINITSFFSTMRYSQNHQYPSWWIPLHWFWWRFIVNTNIVILSSAGNSLLQLDPPCGLRMPALAKWRSCRMLSTAEVWWMKMPPRASQASRRSPRSSINTQLGPLNFCLLPKRRDLRVAKRNNRINRSGDLPLTCNMAILRLPTNI